MHCNCCDRELSVNEIIWNRQLGAWEMCSSCLSASLEAAFGTNYEEEEGVYLDDGTESDVSLDTLVSSSIEEVW